MQPVGFNVSVILDLQGISVNVRENIDCCKRSISSAQNYEFFLLKWMKMKDKAKAFPTNSNKLIYFGFL